MAPLENPAAETEDAPAVPVEDASAAPVTTEEPKVEASPAVPEVAATA